MNNQLIAKKLREEAEFIRQEAERRMATLVAAAEILETVPGFDYSTLKPPKDGSGPASRKPCAEPSVTDIIRSVCCEKPIGEVVDNSDVRTRAKAVLANEPKLLERFERGFYTAKAKLIADKELEILPGGFARTPRMLPTRLQLVAPDAANAPDAPKNDGVTCDRCGHYLPGHATSGADICTCATDGGPA